MFDTAFFMKMHELKKRIVQAPGTLDPEGIFKAFEECRSRRPYIFNIETTNVCNMKCVMCPRTSLMDRKLTFMEMDLFEKVIDQITPYTAEEKARFEAFIKKEYGLTPETPDQNSFYFFVSSSHVTLHGYGEPLLDPSIGQRVQMCTDRGISTYFSCVPANIDVPKVTAMMKAGLGVIKFAMDAMDDETQKQIRGSKNNFTEAVHKIEELIEIKRQDPSLKTRIVLTMVELSAEEGSLKLQEEFKKFWSDKPVYCYVKSQDNRWLYEEDEDMEVKAHYEQQYCEYPFTSMTVQVDGKIVPYPDYNSEIVFGDANKESLEEIWNNKIYENLRRMQISGAFPGGHKCSDRCDQKMVCDRIGKLRHLEAVQK